MTSDIDNEDPRADEGPQVTDRAANERLSRVWEQKRAELGITGPSRLRCYTDTQDTQEKQRDTKKDKEAERQEEANPHSLCFEEFVTWAARHSAAEGKEALAEGKFRSPLWTFVRHIRGRCWGGDETADDIFGRVDQALRARGGWAAHFEVKDEEEAYIEFVSNWDAIMYPPGQDPLSIALTKAKECPLTPERSQHRRLRNYALFVSMAGWLQASMGDQPILLPCREIAALLTEHGQACSKMAVSRWRKLAEKDGLLRVTREHSFRSAGNSRATEFLFDMSQFDRLREAAGRTDQ